MLILTSVEINKYKSFSTTQTTTIENDITAIVGKNESGKTGFLEALAKFNYFKDDDKYKFDVISDFPRTGLKKYQRRDEHCEVIRCTFKVSDELLSQIYADIGTDVKLSTDFSYGITYEGEATWNNLSADEKVFIDYLLKTHEFTETIKQEFSKQKTLNDLISYIQQSDYLKDSDVEDVDVEDVDVEDVDVEDVDVEDVDVEDVENTTAKIKMFNDFLTKLKINSYACDNLLSGYIAKKYLQPNFPKFWYFDEYYALPSRININHLKKDAVTDELDVEALETSKALFELANIDINELIQSTDFERFKIELEATSNEITDQIFEYWKSNENLEIEFAIDIKTISEDPYQVEKILDIRVKNTKHRVTLPLKNRSKGFRWFFSFLVWFSKIQADRNKNYILLLDEPGLNLHASAQDDLLRFIEKLAEEYQIIYSTHSPFMIDSLQLHRVRTIFDSEEGSKISDAIQEKDPDTLFPLQAALGYDIAQNLFISKNNLLVEGPADLLYLSIISNILESKGRDGLNPDITIVPTGGLDKVATFISLMKGSKLNIVCLLDTFNDPKSKERVADLIRNKIIRGKNVKYFNEFVNVTNNKADIEDLFKKEEYLSLFNSAHSEHKDINIIDLNDSIPNIIIQINTSLGIERFNHYRPAYEFAKMKDIDTFFSDDTLNIFETMFKEINKLF